MTIATIDRPARVPTRSRGLDQTPVPDLLTRKGKECLRRADAVLHERLVSDALLVFASAHAKIIDVGKKAGKQGFTQRDIEAQMIRRARGGEIVVRLKDGDPFVFGRGGEEAQALARAGIPFEIVPGVSSAIAVPAYAGIPVTHRGLSSSVVFITGHQPEKFCGAN